MVYAKLAPVLISTKLKIIPVTVDIPLIISIFLSIEALSFIFSLTIFARAYSYLVKKS